MKNRMTVNMDDVSKPYLEKLYSTVLGRVFLKILISPIVSKFVGFCLDRKISKVLIPGFIRNNHIDIALYEDREYTSFNDFFTREKKSEYKTFNEDRNVFISPCDAYLSVYQLNEKNSFKIKNVIYSVDSLIEDDKAADEFKDGLCLIFRLSVDDYHRYCYVDSGYKSDNHYIKGVLHTVQPIAVVGEKALVKNSREYTFLFTDNFGKIVQVEIGALLVGRIKNHHGAQGIIKGQEKGFFEYGGSTIVLLLKKDVLIVDNELLENSSKGIETKVKYGESIGVSPKYNKPIF